MQGGESARGQVANSLLILALLALSTSLHAADYASPPLGPNVHVFTPRMPLPDIQRVADDIAARQLDNQFGSDRYALLFAPGIYGSKDQPLTIKVGYYTQVAGLGRKPTEVLIHGVVQVRNRCFNGACLALDTFWRSLSNLSLTIPESRSDCEGQVWAVSQAAPVRRIKVSGGDFKLTDVCSTPGFASGGFIADSQFDGDVTNGLQQQFLIRNSRLAHWRGGNWNQVFLGVQGALPVCPPQDAACPYFSVPLSPVTREAPFLYRDREGKFRVFRPGLRFQSQGVSWGAENEPGASIPLDEFFLASPRDGAAAMNAALNAGKHLLLTPGVYHLSETLKISHRDLMILGLGFPTLIPDHGLMAMRIAAPGVAVSGVLFEAGSTQSPELLRVGEPDEPGEAGDPTTLHDVFFRVGGAAVGKAAVSLVVNQSHVILDHVWAWRADHGEGVGWDQNVADTGLIVRGDAVTAYGLFVEHYQKDEVIWQGEDGTAIFFQNEMPYDAPAQAAWRQGPDHDGYPAWTLSAGVTRFRGVGFGSYCYFNRGLPIFAEEAFKVPDSLPAGSLRDVFTIFLNAKTSGGIRHVVNRQGGAVGPANADQAMRLASYP